MKHTNTLGIAVLLCCGLLTGCGNADNQIATTTPIVSQAPQQTSSPVASATDRPVVYMTTDISSAVSL